MPDPYIFFSIAGSVADAAAVNRNDIKMLLAGGLSIFFMNGKAVFTNDPKSLPKNPPSCTFLDSWVFDNFILVDEPFAKTLRSLETCVSVNSNLYGKLVSSLQSAITFDEIFKVTSVLFIIPGFNLLSCELDNFTFKVLSHFVLILYKPK